MSQSKQPRRRGRRDGGVGGHGGSGGKNGDKGGREYADTSSSNGTSPKLSYKPHNTLLVQLNEDTPTWYECGRNAPGRDDVISSADDRRRQQNAREGLVSRYRNLANEAYEHEVALAKQKGSGNSEEDEKWVENTMRRGTLKDRIAAMSVVVGGDPVHKLHALDMLMDLAGCAVRDDSGNDRGGAAAHSTPNSRIGQMASEALSDLFSNSLVPRDRKMVSLDARPFNLYEGGGGGNNKNLRTLSPRILLLWRYEEMIKVRYASYLARYLGRTLAGEDELSKRRALTTAAFLLKEVPEGEEQLLNMVVNKIGDPHRKVASAAGHQLREVLVEHPVMVKVVAREVQQLAHRPHLSSRALYNCIVFLNQLQLSKEDEAVEGAATSGEEHTRKQKSLAASLINTYFRLFEVAVKKADSNPPIAKGKSAKGKSAKGGSSSNVDDVCVKSRLLSALLTGVNRAHPYLPRKDAAMEEHVDALYRIAHTAPPAAATQALMLLFNLAVGSGDLDGDGEAAEKATRKDGGATSRKDRFYRALYSKVGVVDMYTGRQLTMFFNLLYKAAKNDDCASRLCAFSKRLLYTTLHLTPSVACGALFLLSEIVRGSQIADGVGKIPAGSVFDPSKREPRLAFGDNKDVGDGVAGDETLSAALYSSNMWEVSLLAHHFHPSVSKFAPGIDGDIQYKGDPLKDFALAPFLDKFAFRNPKSMDKLSKHLKRGESIAERKSGLGGGIKMRTSLPMNDPSYLKTANVAGEDQFFHSFFAERAKRDDLKGIVRGPGDARAQDPDAQDPDDGSDLEDNALNATEHDDDEDWESDPEEQAFATELAEKMMESAAGGKGDLDDEDPDMDDWSDVDDDDDDEEADEGEDDDDDDEDFSEMDGPNAASSNVGKHEDGFMDDVSSDEDGDSDGSGGDIHLLSALADDSDDEPEPEEQPSKKKKKHEPEEQQSKKKKKPKPDIYADAEDYEEIIEKGLMDHESALGKASANEDTNGEDTISKKEAVGKESKKGKKRQRRSKHS